MYASGGVASDLGILLLVNIAVIANFAKARYTFLFAAIAASVILTGELLASWLLGSAAAHLTETATLGIALFAVALVTTLLLKHQARHQQPQTITRLSNAQLKELKEQIVEEIDSGVLHLDSEDRVQLINSKAASLLGVSQKMTGVPLFNLCAPLSNILELWRKNPEAGLMALSDPSISHDVLPHFSILSDQSLLIRLEDQADINRRVQQLKQASLGRMSSSIAHEIRNPLGAIANAIQLLEESEDLGPEDRELAEIAYKHTGRINRIVEDVMQLSARSNVQTEDIVLDEFVRNFSHRFVEQNDLAPQTMQVQVQAGLIVPFDAHHIDQVLWNLCNNAIIHNTAEKPEVYIHVYSDPGGVPIMDISDNGSGIPRSNMDNIFEPFFTTRTGTGLGLYICRELCALNGAWLDCVPVSRGSCFRIRYNSGYNSGHNNVSTHQGGNGKPGNDDPGDTWQKAA